MKSIKCEIAQVMLILINGQSSPNSKLFKLIFHKFLTLLWNKPTVESS